MQLCEYLSVDSKCDKKGIFEVFENLQISWQGIPVTLAGHLYNKYSQWQCLGTTKVRKESLRFPLHAEDWRESRLRNPCHYISLGLEEAFCK